MEHFHALPPELNRQCLLRVPYTSHNTIAAVCKSCEALVKSPQFYEDRRKLCISQQFICLIEFRTYGYGYFLFAQEFVIAVHDPVQGTWEELPRLPRGIPDRFRWVCVNLKLLLIGGRNSNYVERQYSVFIYDFSSAKWSRGTDCPLETVDAACSVSAEGLVYVAGGMDRNDNAVRGAAVYNVEKDEWKLLPHMNQKWDHCFGTFIDGKFTVIDGHSAPWVKRSKANAEVYDLEKGA